MESDLVFALFAMLAGAVSVLTPCVLVMLPVILAVTGGEGKRRVIGVLVGLEISFIGISLLASAALEALGLPPRTQEIAAGVVILALGATLLVPALHRRFELWTSMAVNRMPGLTGKATTGSGFAGGLVGGLGLGLVWAPCAGPILAFVIAAANTDGFTSRSVIAAVAYGIGMLGPLLLVFTGGHAMVARLRRRFGARRLDVAMGSTMVVAAAFILFGGFTAVNREIARLDLSSTPIASIERKAVDRSNEAEVARIRAAHGTTGKGDLPSRAELEVNGYPESHDGELRDLGPAPALAGIGRTYNVRGGGDLDPEYLKGKVVVYDFWTYSCINCIRTLPYLRELYEKYEQDGLVIVGLHAPEFAFEKDESNVRQAIRDLDVTWPVATDPELTTWQRFHNHYWPAKYITDRDGEIRYVHYGEGGYDDTEAVIRELLDKAPAKSDLPSGTGVQAATPETYVGLARLSGDQWRGLAANGERVAEGDTTYRLDGGGASELAANQFSLVGPWRMEDERSVATGAGSQIVIRYQARAVYLVLDPGERGAVDVKVVDSAKEGGGTRTVRVDSDRLYTLRDGKGPADATMRITVPKGASAYAFTFG